MPTKTIALLLQVNLVALAERIELRAFVVFGLPVFGQFDIDEMRHPSQETLATAIQQNLVICREEQ